VRLKSTAHGCCAVEKFSTALQPLQPHFNRARKFLTYFSMSQATTMIGMVGTIC